MAGKLVYVNSALTGEPVGSSKRDGSWAVRYGPVALGVIDHRGDHLRAASRALDLWTTLPVPTASTAQPQQQHERNQKVYPCVGQIRHPCPRLL